MSQTVTISQVLQANIANLSNIRVPMGLLNEVGMPIARTIEDLKVCVQAIENVPKPESKPEEDPEEAIDLGNIEEDTEN